MELAAVHTPVAAFVAGLVTSLHCVGMCGPLACWLRPGRTGEDAATIFATYQGMRLASYTLLGLLAGALGGLPLAWLGDGALRWIPWALVAFFVSVALRLDRHLGKSLLLVRLGLRVQQWARPKSGLAAAAALGAATPLLPCGPLYFVAALAALTGSAARGAEFMLAFGLGTLPLLWFAQAQFGWLRARLSPVAIGRIQRSLALAAALVVAWRLRGSFGFGAPQGTDWLCF
jgi:sulfite exporter TauE/SafE